MPRTPPRDRPLLRLLRAAWDLVTLWWRVDRVRPSAAEAALLRLEPPCVTIFDGGAIEVVRRNVEETPDGPRVVYECRTDDGPRWLVVVPGGLGRAPVARWLNGGITAGGPAQRAGSRSDKTPTPSTPECFLTDPTSPQPS